MLISNVDGLWSPGTKVKFTQPEALCDSVGPDVSVVASGSREPDVFAPREISDCGSSKSGGALDGSGHCEVDVSPVRNLAGDDLTSIPLEGPEP